MMNIHFQVTPLGIALAIVTVIITVTIHLLWLRHNKHPHPASHLFSRWSWHLPLPLFIVFLVGLFAGVAFAYGFGGSFNKNLHIKVPSSIVAAGGFAPFSVDLSRYLPVVLNQGQTNACGAFAVSEALYMGREQRGELVPSVAWSPWYNYWYATNGNNGVTDLPQEMNSYSRYGVVPLEWQPNIGYPSYFERSHATGRGGNWHYLFYGSQGGANLPAIKAELNAGHPVILLISIHSGFQAAFGSQYTDNTGGFVGYHWIVAYGYTGDTLWLRNSWGTGFGVNGNIGFTPYATANTVLAAGVVTPGPITWPRAPIITPKPVVKPKPKPKPIVKPVKLGQSYIVIVAQYLRPRPATQPSSHYLVRRGVKVTALKGNTAHWKAVRIKSGVYGWLLKRNIRKQ